MACPTGRCALRRFDGHGSSGYRPTNPEAARQFNSDMERMMAERSQQDSCWLQPAAAAATATADSSKPTLPVSVGMFRQKTPEMSPAPAVAVAAAAAGERPAAAAAGNTTAGNAAAAAADPKYCWALSS